MKEYVLVVIKPDGMVKSLAGKVISRLSLLGLQLVAAQVVAVSKELAEEHYKHLADKPFYQRLVDLFLGKFHGTNEVLAVIYTGENAIARCREAVGATNPEEALPTTIRGAYGRITTEGIYENVVHVSSDTQEAEREIKLWFSPLQIGKEIYPIENRENVPCAQTAWA